MNERIRELAVQARKEFLELPTGYSPEQVGMYPQLMEKFAELIVRECTQLLFTESERLYAYSSECDNMRDSDEAELCAEKCIDNITMIEEHFGVE
jgi:hypothetical protein